MNMLKIETLVYVSILNALLSNSTMQKFECYLVSFSNHHTFVNFVNIMQSPLELLYYSQLRSGKDVIARSGQSVCN
jgi:hypothetical protein